MAYFFAGFLARQQHDLQTAIRHAEEAHSILGYHDTALLLGNILIWSHRFSEGQEYLEFALDGSSPKMRRMATTSIVESWRRWAESSIESQNPIDGFDKALSGVAVGRQTILLGIQDHRLGVAVLASLREALKAFERAGDRSTLDDERLAKEIRFVVDWIGFFRGLSEWARFTDQLVRAAKLVLPGNPIAQASAAMMRADLTRSESEIFARAESNTTLVLRGTISSLLSTYGFLAHPNYPQGIFFHYGALGAGVQREQLLSGKPVEFELELRADKRVRAVGIMPLTN